MHRLLGVAIAAGAALLAASCVSSYSTWLGDGVSGGENSSDNQPPVAQLGVYPHTGSAPLKVQPDATGCWDIDGKIASYDWDFDGDGTFDLLGGPALPAVHTYDTAGVYNATVRVTDNGGLSATASAEVTVTSTSLPPTDQLPTLSAAKWQGGAEAALSLSFDDATPEHWSRGLPLFQEYGFHVTLGVFAKTFQDAPERLPQLQEAFDAGHELANHSTTHSDFTTLTSEERRQEIATCQQLLVDNVDGLDRVVTFIYPYQGYDDEIIATLSDMGYLFARSGLHGISDYAPVNDAVGPNFMHLYSWANLNTLEQWQWDSVPDVAINKGGWMIEQCHGIGDVGEQGVGWSPRPESEYREHFDHIASFGDRLWVAPIGTVGRYIMERNAAKFTVLDASTSGFSFTLTDGLDNVVFDVPVTVEMELPEGWTGAQVRQGTTTLAVIAPETGGLRFDVTPGAGVVVVESN